MIRSAGHLNPGDPQVRFSRLDIGLDPLVRHVWIVRWCVPAGQSRAQRVLTYPAGNIVVSPADATLHGPDPSVQVRELRGESWVVGVLLRPAALTVLTSTPPPRLVSSFEPLADAPRAQLVEAMDMARSDPDAAAAQIVHDWLAPAVDRVTASGLLANDAAQLAEDSPDLLRVTDLAARLGVSERTVTRVVRSHIGVSAKWLIECRRLQTAATRLFAHPDTDLAGLAAELGYADQAHFTRRYRAVLGQTPDQTRRSGRGAA